jgi:hypothetical protein
MVCFTAASAVTIIAFGAMIEPIHAGIAGAAADAISAVSKGAQVVGALTSGSKPSSRRDTENQIKYSL